MDLRRYRRDFRVREHAPTNERSARQRRRQEHPIYDLLVTAHEQEIGFVARLVARNLYATTIRKEKGRRSQRTNVPIHVQHPTSS